MRIDRLIVATLALTVAPAALAQAPAAPAALPDPTPGQTVIVGLTSGDAVKAVLVAVNGTIFILDRRKGGESLVFMERVPLSDDHRQD